MLACLTPVALQQGALNNVTGSLQRNYSVGKRGFPAANHFLPVFQRDTAQEAGSKLEEGSWGGGGQGLDPQLGISLLRSRKAARVQFSGAQFPLQ